jgi:hypothetical protein
MPLAAIFGGFKAITGIFGARGQSKADKQRVRLQFEDNLEKIRRRSFTQKQVLGAAKALGEASGVRHTGGSSAQGAIDSMATEFKKELDWMKKYAVTAKRLGLKQARLDYSKNVIGSVTDAVSSFI